MINETNMSDLIGNVTHIWGEPVMQQMFADNSTVVYHYTGAISTYSQVIGIDLVIQFLTVIMVCSVLSTLLLAGLVWKMYFGSGEK